MNRHVRALGYATAAVAVWLTVPTAIFFGAFSLWHAIHGDHGEQDSGLVVLWSIAGMIGSGICFLSAPFSFVAIYVLLAIKPLATTTALRETCGHELHGNLSDGACPDCGAKHPANSK